MSSHPGTLAEGLASAVAERPAGNGGRAAQRRALGRPVEIFSMDADERKLRALLLVLAGVALVLAAAAGLAFVRQGSASFGLSAAGLGAAGIAALLVRRMVTRTTLGAGARAMSWTLLAIVLVFVVLGNRAPTLAMTAVLAVLISVPYVDARALRRLALVAFGLSVGVAIGYGAAAPPDTVAGMPAEAVVRFVGMVALSGLSLFAIVHVGARLSTSVERYRDLFQRVPVGMYRSTPDGRFLDVNEAFAEMFGVARPEDLHGISALELYADPLDRAGFREAVDGAGVAHRVEFRAKRRDGTTFWVRDSALLVRDSSGSPLYYEGILEDATETKHREQKLEQRASVDALTGLANRAVLTDALDDALRQASADRPVALLFVDLDDFKQINDRFGHAAGDETLAGAARRISDATRDADIAARFGGDEFAVLLRQPAARDAAESVARRIAAAFREPFNVAGDAIVVGASIGIAVADEPMANAELIERADRAMYRAKNQDRIEVFGR